MLRTTIQNTVVLFVMLSCQLSSQSGGVNTFFPYAVGNRWEYKSPGGSVSGYTIIRDSVSADGEIFLFTTGTLYHSPRFRIRTDSSVLQYVSPTLYSIYYKLNYTVGEQWTVSANSFSKLVAKVESIYLYPYFGQSRLHARIAHYTLGLEDSIRPGMTASGREIMVVGFGEVKSLDGDMGATLSYLNGCIINGTQFGILSEVDEGLSKNKTERLFNNYPNPFTGTTVVNYSLPREEFVTIEVFNTLGEKITTIREGYKPAGEHKVTLNLPGVSKGVYLCRVQAGGVVKTIKMLCSGD